MLFLTPNQQCQSTEGKNLLYMQLWTNRRTVPNLLDLFKVQMMRRETVLKNWFNVCLTAGDNLCYILHSEIKNIFVTWRNESFAFLIGLGGILCRSRSGSRHRRDDWRAKDPATRKDLCKGRSPVCMSQQLRQMKLCMNMQHLHCCAWDDVSLDHLNSAWPTVTIFTVQL